MLLLRAVPVSLWSVNESDSACQTNIEKDPHGEKQIFFDVEIQNYMSHLWDCSSY